MENRDFLESGSQIGLRINIIKDGELTDPYSVDQVDIFDDDSQLIKTYSDSEISKVEDGVYSITLNAYNDVLSTTITNESLGIGDGDNKIFNLENYPASDITVFKDFTSVPTSDYSLNSYVGEIIFDEAPNTDVSISASYTANSRRAPFDIGDYQDRWTITLKENFVPETFQQEFSLIDSEWNSFNGIDDIQIDFILSTKVIAKNTKEYLKVIATNNLNIERYGKATVSIYDKKNNIFVEDQEMLTNGTQLKYLFEANYSEGDYYAIVKIDYGTESIVSHKLYFKIK